MFFILLTRETLRSHVFTQLRHFKVPFGTVAKSKSPDWKALVQNMLNMCLMIRTKKSLPGKKEKRNKDKHWEGKEEKTTSQLSLTWITASEFFPLIHDMHYHSTKGSVSRGAASLESKILRHVKNNESSTLIVYFFIWFLPNTTSSIWERH